jgi:hypothetical protein
MNQGVKLVEMLLDTAAASTQDLRTRVTNMRYAGLDVAEKKNCDCILFEFDGKPHFGEMRGRYFNSVMLSGASNEADKSIAVGLMLDGHCTCLESIEAAVPA